VIRQRAGTEVVLIALALLMAAGALLIVRFLPETLAGAGSTDGDGGRPPGEGRRTWTRLLRDPRLRVSFLGIGILMAAVGTVTAFVPVQLEMRGEPASFGGALFSAFGLVAVAVMLSRASGMVDRYGPVLPSVGGLVALAGALVLLVGTGGVPGVAAAMIMLGLGYGLLFPGTAGAIALAAVPAERGRAYGVFNVAFDLGVTAGPLLGGLLAAGAATGTSGAAFVPALVLVLLGIPALIALGRRAHGGLPGVQDA
jgi:predicted MFS family arabinose efflux permease